MTDKKLKVGDVVGWVVVDDWLGVVGQFDTREQAREEMALTKARGHDARLAKIVLSK